jgi:hypothetical protein
MSAIAIAIAIIVAALWNIGSAPWRITRRSRSHYYCYRFGEVSEGKGKESESESKICGKREVPAVHTDFIIHSVQCMS